MIPLPATFIVRWRWPIVAAWVLLVALLVPAAQDVHERLQVGGQKLREFESARADRILRERFAAPFTAFVVVAVKHDSLRAGQPRFDAYVDSLALALQRLPFVLQTLSPRHGAAAQQLLSADGHIALLVAGLRKDSDADPPNYVPRIRAALRETQANLGDGFRTHVTGSPAFDYDTRIITAEDSSRIERFVLPIALLLLVVAFGTLAGAAMPTTSIPPKPTERVSVSGTTISPISPIITVAPT